ncbi:rhomboid family intramembrane serine protease [Rhodobacteraceae bacterium N5(2021)]|uniref:Rhomboid family intramembrane serine protease n=1 Tax=Gymnodinialimonas phycosphaerae TaxID=2841589 RepID=A0A975TZT6_9RHOB|nr:rhomboid family intramembrane serine protease [Gymnodinialimonas phycosphaerae]MBY4893037.1 rhomboid family intramembrane serine protease [Gymnodinialimonas phycosphaerae]
MFPIRDHNPSERTPFVTWALIAINVVVFLLYFPSMAGNEAQFLAFYTEWGLVPQSVLSGGGAHTVLTSMFLHGGWMHLIGNMVFLWIFGDNLEDLMGHLGFAFFYLASGVAAAGGQILADPSSTLPMVGASGAIAGVMGGYLLMFPRARLDVLVILVVFVRIFTIPAWLMLGLWFGLQLVSGLSMDLVGGGVAYWAHAGGFLAGVVLAWPLWMRRGARGYWAAFGGKQPHPEVEYRVSRRHRSPIPAVRRVRSPKGVERPLADLGRVPRAGTRRTPSGPWSGRR